MNKAQAYIKLPAIFLCSVLFSCGGGGENNSGAGSSSTKNGSPPRIVPHPPGPLESVNNWQALMNSSALDLTEQELKNAYWGYALNEYGGILDPVILDASSGQKFADLLFFPWNKSAVPIQTQNILQAVNIGLFGYIINENYVQEDMTLDTYLGCDYMQVFIPNFNPGTPEDGYLEIQGEVVNENVKANFEFIDCVTMDGTYSGKAFITATPRWNGSGNSITGFTFYESLQQSYITEAPTRTVSGYYQYNPVYDDVTFETRVVERNEAIVSINEETGEVLLRKLLDIYNYDYLVANELSGNLAISTLGSVKVSYEEKPYPGNSLTNYSVNTFHFTGQNNTRLSIDLLRYGGYSLASLDTDGDGTYDLGRYYFSPYGFRYADLVSEPLLPYSQLDQPPVFRFRLSYLYQYPDNGKDAIVEVPSEMFFDPDTPLEDLEVINYWELNGQLVPEITSTTFPASLLQVGDYLRFYFTVSDGETTIQSDYWETSVLY